MIRPLACISLLLLAATQLAAQVASVTPPVQNLGGDHWEQWAGVTPGPDGALIQSPPDGVTFRYPDGPKGFYKHGFRVENDGTADWNEFYGLRLQIKLPADRMVMLTAAFSPASPGGGIGKPIASTVNIAGDGWHTVTLPWSAFQFQQIRTSPLTFVKQLTITARFQDGKPAAELTLGNVSLIKAPAVSLECAIRGKSAARGQLAVYPVIVSNCTAQPEAVSLSFIRHGWEVMEPAVTPSTLELAPGESKTCTVSVRVSDRVPAGGHEEQTLQAIANGDAAAAETLPFVTVSLLQHPYITETPAGWTEIRNKVTKYPWAKEAQEAYVKTAQAWAVPEVAKPPTNDPNDTMGPYLFHTDSENGLLACAYTWQLTGDKSSAQKVALFLRRLSDPGDGYPITLRGCNQSLVQEGHFFQHLAMAYDMILDSGVLNDADRAQIEATFRIFMQTIDRENRRGAINNWNLSEVTGAFYCSLAMQDLVSADRFFSGPSGIKDQLAKGTMDDGWWYECSISYNLWCASEFTQAALAWRPFGVNFADMWVPASYSPMVMLAPELSGGVVSPGQTDRPFGMDPTVVGPLRRTYRTITDLWNSMLPFIDYRGVMFGVNDSTENKVTGYRTEVGGQPFELAYNVFRNPRYAAMIKLGDGHRDLLYSVPDLPENTPQQYRDSAYADNVGLAMLRSQTPNRPIREQIQAVLHYGTHGWAHGHYDRTDLLSLMRYGRSFWNPESVFYVYEPFMYKFYTQTSENHNMVVVDEKMQEATPGQRLLFYSGTMMQAAAVQTTARWSYPPYGGMVYDYVPVNTFAEKTWREGRFVPIPPHPPAYGAVTGYTEPVLQRRLMVVTDDYVVLADYLKGTNPHTFESLLQIKGFEGLNAPQKQFLKHDAQWTTDPLSGGQFVTDCDWYSVHAPAVARFQERWGPGEDNEGSRSVANENGVLNLDVHSLWPQSQQIMVATAPEQHDVEKRLYYSVRGDGKTLAQGKFGAWILGQADIDLPLSGVKQLELETSTELSKRPTLFWANARIETSDGKEIPLSALPVTMDNIVTTRDPAHDYLGGPIKIAGNEYQQGVPAEPKDSSHPGLIHLDLTGLHATRLKAVLGSDYPPGPEAQRRKVYAIRVADQSEARFLTLIEPYETAPVVKSAEALGPDKLHVELTDGRSQDLEIHDIEQGKNIGVTIVESRDGKVVRQEQSVAQAEGNP